MDKNQSFPYAPHHHALLDDNQHTLCLPHPAATWGKCLSM